MLKTTAIVSLIALGAFTLVTPVAMAATTGFSAVDTDHDGTISLAEAQKAGMAKFATLDTDHEGTLDSKEAGMDVSAMDPDKDGTVSKTEYAGALDAAFKKADPDGDGTVDAKELDSPTGKDLDAMIKP